VTSSWIEALPRLNRVIPYAERQDPFLRRVCTAFIRGPFDIIPRRSEGLRPHRPVSLKISKSGIRSHRPGVLPGGRPLRPSAAPSRSTLGGRDAPRGGSSLASLEMLPEGDGFPPEYPSRSTPSAAKRPVAKRRGSEELRGGTIGGELVVAWRWVLGLPEE